MAEFGKKININELIFLAVASLACFGMSTYRIMVSHSWFFTFLNWNLFLAAIPYIVSRFALHQSTSKKTLFCILFVWLLFFPNAPYILTDLFHLRNSTSMPLWYDLIMILSFAWTGLLFGFLSLWDIEKLLSLHLRKSMVRIISISMLFLSSFGIYLGRYLRWNSWDIVSRPLHLLSDIQDRFLSPLDHPRTWGVTIFMGLFLVFLHFSIDLFRKRTQ